MIKNNERLWELKIIKDSRNRLAEVRSKNILTEWYIYIYKDFFQIFFIFDFRLVYGEFHKHGWELTDLCYFIFCGRRIL